MSSEILTESAGPHAAASGRPTAAAAAGLQPWQFFVLAGLACATALVFLLRGQGFTTVALGTIVMATTVLVGLAALRTLRPLVTAEDDRTVMVGHRTRAALEREKALVLRSIKELEFDHAMGKLAERDWEEMSTRLRARAARLIRQLDAGAGYRAQIERELNARIASPAEAAPAGERACRSCQTVNEPDARFCKACGARLGQ
jgi:hypothetical protein